MNDIAIRVSNLSKCYQIYDTPRDRLKQFVVPKLHRIVSPLSKFFSSPQSSALSPQSSASIFYKEFWALKDVSFEVKKGETVGIIGRNGSGKSSLLQIICGTLSPTSGSVTANGRISALLELGAGFNPEFTGRENVYLYAAVLGLSKEEIDARFDDIVAFADIGEFIEQPVKTYSSGMMVRLAFSVAINVDPEILIIDEALSVGDELFQRKCFSRIDAIRANGATILFVSHSGGQIVELCDRAILMDSGESLAIGMPKQIVACYQKMLYAPDDRNSAIRDQIRLANEQRIEIATHTDEILNARQEGLVHVPKPQESFDPSLKPSSTVMYESNGAYIEAPLMLTLAGERVNNLVRGNNYIYTYTVRFTKSVSNVRFAMLIKSTSGVQLGGGVSSNSLKNSLPYVKMGACYRIEFHFRCSLNPGIYFLNAGVLGADSADDTYLHRVLDAATFRVLPEDGCLTTGWVDFGCYSEVELLQ